MKHRQHGSCCSLNTQHALSVRIMTSNGVHGVIIHCLAGLVVDYGLNNHASSSEFSQTGIESI